MDVGVEGTDRNLRGTILKLLAGVVGSFCFAFLLVPLYDAICEITGLNGKTGGAYEYVAADLKADRSRLVQIRFVTNSNAGLPWAFGAKSGGMRVHPGSLNEAHFHASNPTDRVMVAQAIPSVAPGRAAAYFHKTQCFCFEQQVLAPGQSIAMPVRFIVASDLPASVQTITLSYSMFDITNTDAGHLAIAKYEQSKQRSGTGLGGELEGSSAGN